MERARVYLDEIAKEEGGLTHIVCEARGEKEDRELELEFRRIVAGAIP
jgi:hypothetical protein